MNQPNNDQWIKAGGARFSAERNREQCCATTAAAHTAQGREFTSPSCLSTPPAVDEERKKEDKRDQERRTSTAFVAEKCPSIS
jgi:hypothetical protein